MPRGRKFQPSSGSLLPKIFPLEPQTIFAKFLGLLRRLSIGIRSLFSSFRLAFTLSIRLRQARGIWLTLENDKLSVVLAKSQLSYEMEPSRYAKTRLSFSGNWSHSDNNARTCSL